MLGDTIWFALASRCASLSRMCSTVRACRAGTVSGPGARTRCAAPTTAMAAGTRGSCCGCGVRFPLRCYAAPVGRRGSTTCSSRHRRRSRSSAASSAFTRPAASRSAACAADATARRLRARDVRLRQRRARPRLRAPELLFPGTARARRSAASARKPLRWAAGGTAMREGAGGTGAFFRGSAAALQQGQARCRRPPRHAGTRAAQPWRPPARGCAAWMR